MTQFPDMEDKTVRADFVADKVTTGIGEQITAMREAKGWSMAEMGKRMNRPEAWVARLEAKKYEKYGLPLLLEIAALFDAWLNIEFMDYRAGQARTEETKKSALSWERERRAEVKPDKAPEPAAPVKPEPAKAATAWNDPADKPAAKPASEPWTSRAMGPGKQGPKK